MNKRKLFINIFIFLIAISCSHYPSGNFVYLKKDQTHRDLSEKFRIPAWKIRDANAGQDSFNAGEWVFIPNQKGILPKLKNKIPINSTSLPDFIKSQGLLWPVPSQKKVSSKFGKRWGKKHEGIDIPARMGASIVSIADGVVVYSGKGLRGYGNLTVISHFNGLYSVYGHAKKNLTSKGQKISRGEVIALVGKTGRATGPHLHFELRNAGEAINPLLVYRPVD